MTRVTYVCSRCKSDLISFDATVYWDANDQEFQICNFNPTGASRAYCVPCDANTDADEVPYVEEDQ